jgi:hypothetical protein
LLLKKDEVEEMFGEKLEWQRLDNRQASRIRYLIEEHGLKDQEYWPKLQEQLIDAMIRLTQALLPEIQKLG